MGKILVPRLRVLSPAGLRQRLELGSKIARALWTGDGTILRGVIGRSSHEVMGVSSQVRAELGARRGIPDPIILTGRIHAVLRGPDGRIKQEQWNRNLILDNGDLLIPDILDGGTAGGTGVGAFHGMSLGTGFTAVAKGDTALQTVIASSYDTSDSVADITNSLRIISSWAAGEATSNGIDEVGLWTNGMDGGASSGTMTSRAQLTPEINKGASDTLTITWDWTFLGA